MLEVMRDAETWVALGFVLFIGLLAYLGVHRKIGDTLDQRQARIKGELDEARRLKEEAAALLAELQRKGQEAEGDAAAIVASAKAEAERLAAEAKITQAEAQAVADVRAAAADAAVAAAEKILAAATKGKIAEDLLAQGIEDVRKKF